MRKLVKNTSLAVQDAGGLGKFKPPYRGAIGGLSPVERTL